MIDNRRIGRAIRTLREKAGYTQRGLAEKLYVSDMAVSKWETGKSIPDVSTLKKMAVVLDMDIDGLLDGTASWLDDKWAGMMLPDSRMNMILYDKPLIDYMISYFLLAGIRKIYFCTENMESNCIRQRYRNGESLGIQFSDLSNGVSEENFMLIANPVFVYGVDLTRFMQRAMSHPDSIVNLQTVVGKGKSARDSQTCSTYEYCATPFYFFRNVELDPKLPFSELQDAVRKDERFLEEPMDKGFICSELQTSRELEDVNAVVRSIQNLCGYMICCPFEIAWRRGMIGFEKMKQESLSFPEYKDYIHSLR